MAYRQSYAANQYRGASGGGYSSYSSGGQARYSGAKRSATGGAGGAAKRGRNSFGNQRRGGRAQHKGTKFFVELRPANFLFATSTFEIPEPVKAVAATPQKETPAATEEEPKTNGDAAAADAEMTETAAADEAEEATEEAKPTEEAAANGDDAEAKADDAAKEAEPAKPAAPVLPTEATLAAELLSGDILAAKSTATLRLGKDNKYKFSFEIRDQVQKGKAGRFELWVQQDSVANITLIDLEQQKKDAAKAAAAAEESAKAAAAAAGDVDPNKMKVADLKKTLTDRGLSTEGLKAQLIERLVEYQANNKLDEGAVLWAELHGLDEELAKEDYHSEEAGWDVPALKDDIAILRKQKSAAEAKVEEPVDTENVVYRVVFSLKAAPKILTRDSTFWSTEKASQIRTIVLDFKRGKNRTSSSDPKVAFDNVTGEKGFFHPFVEGGEKYVLPWAQDGEFALASTIERLISENETAQEAAAVARAAKDQAEKEERERKQAELKAKREAEEARRNAIIFPQGDLNQDEFGQNVQTLLSETVRVWHSKLVKNAGVQRKDIEDKGRYASSDMFTKGLLQAALLSQASTIKQLQERVEKLENDQMTD